MEQGCRWCFRIDAVSGPVIVLCVNWLKIVFFQVFGFLQPLTKMHIVCFLTHFWPFIAYRLNEWVGCEEVTDIHLVCQLSLPQFGCGPYSSWKWIKAQSKNIKAAYTAKTLCVKCWALAKMNTSNPDLYSCPSWFRVEGSQGAQKYPHPHWAEKNSHPNSSSSQVSESSISGGRREVDHK